MGIYFGKQLLERHWPWLVGGLYLAGVNPYLLPSTYDNVVYFFGAESMASGDGYRFEGQRVSQWPPMLSLCLTPLFWMGAGSVAAAKVFVIVCAVLGLYAARQFLKESGHFAPNASCLLCALCSSGFLMGTRVMSEWLFLLISFAFLLALPRLTEPASSTGQTVRNTALVGALLGTAALTRWIGVLLGAALLTQLVLSERTRQSASHWLRRVAPGLSAAALGASFFVGYKLYLAAQAGQHDSLNPHYNPIGLAQFNPLSTATVIGDLFVRAKLAASFTGLQWVATAISLVLVTLAGVGVKAKWKRQGTLHPADAYVFATLLLLCFVSWKDSRYVLVIGPFLFSYLLEGASALLRRAPRAVGPRLAPVLMTLWCSVFVAMNLFVLMRGNHSGTYGPLAWWKSHAAEVFYRGHFHDLYRASTRAASHAEHGEELAVLGGENKYVFAFTQLPLSSGKVSEKTAAIIYIDGDHTRVPDEEKARLRSGFEHHETFGKVTLYLRKRG